MAAGLGFKTFTTGEVLTAADVNGYLMQGILVFASEAARNSAITSPQEGQFAFTKDNNSLWYYTGSAWVASGATGDIEGVTAGVGITGGGTSGTVTITNDMATTITASGDIVVGTGSGTYDNLPIGTTGQVLTADTTVSPYKVKWASVSSTPSFKGVYTYIASDQTLNNNTSTAILYDTENFDTDGFHSNTTNKDRITIPAGLGGYYLVVVGAQWNSNSSGYRQITVLKNNTTNVLISDYPGLSVSNSYTGKSAIVNLSAGDYINASGYQNSGGSLALGGGAVATFFSVQYLGA
jgi:hypothetical protein